LYKLFDNQQNRYKKNDNYDDSEEEIKIGQIYLLHNSVYDVLFLKLTGFTKTKKSFVFVILKEKSNYVGFLGGGERTTELALDENGKYIETYSITIPKKALEDGYIQRRIDGSHYIGSIWEGKKYVSYNRD
jgi:hypothetical protein